MTRFLLIYAGPTPWDVEDRLAGNHPLPLMELAGESIEQMIKNLAIPVSAVYRFKKNDACDQAAQIVAKAFKLRPRESASLDEVNLGLWQGMTRGELKFRFPSVFPEWEQNPLAINPPDGESLSGAIERIREALKAILRRNRGGTVALPLRPMTMQIALGLLRREDPTIIVSHLQNIAPMETIEVPDDHFNSS